MDSEAEFAALPTPENNENSAAYETPNAAAKLPKPTKGRAVQLKEQGGNEMNMSPKQTKLLARLHELMRSFKELKARVKVMQANGTNAKV